MVSPQMPNDECNELAAHLDSLQSILKSTRDVTRREALQKVIIYLGNRLATLAEQDQSMASNLTSYALTASVDRAKC
jgi:hypothetical protein